MKLHLFIIAFLLVFQINQVIGQDFAPIGAKWYYTKNFAFSGDVSFLWLESVGDTIINGKDCRILENNGGFMCGFHHEKDFVYYEDSIAYFYVPEIDTFQILYNLKAQKDSSWTIVFGIDLHSKLDTIQVMVDSVSYVTINSKELKKLHVTYQSQNSGWEDLAYTGEILERIGDKNYLFHLNSLSGIVCDGNYSGGLRCYQDSDFGFYSTGIADSCTYIYSWTGIESKNSITDVNIYPNPVSNWANIKSNLQLTYKICLYTVTGELLFTAYKNGDSTIDLSSFAKGLYVLQMSYSDNSHIMRKIIKK